jgi:hypothetical protein
MTSQWDTARALVHDSTNFFRGSAIEHAHWGPPIDGLDGDSKYVDSVIELHNTSGLESLEIKCTFVGYGGQDDSDVVPYEGFFVNISKTDKIRLAEMIVYEHLPQVVEECKRICRSISMVDKSR